MLEGKRGFRVVVGVTHAYLGVWSSSWALLSRNRGDLGSWHRGLARRRLILERSLGLETAERSWGGRAISASAWVVRVVYRDPERTLAFKQMVGREHEAGGETDASNG